MLLLALLAALLVLANLAFHAWTAGWLAPLSVPPPAADDREPQRLARQLRPDSLRLLPPAEAQAAMAPPVAAYAAAPASAPAEGDAAGAPAACLEAGPFDARAAQAAERLLAAAFGGNTSGWSRQPAPDAGWQVVVGPYADDSERRLARSELDRAGIASVPLADVPAAMPGWSLGRHATRDAAAAALADAAQRGMRAARIVAAAPAADAAHRAGRCGRAGPAGGHRGAGRRHRARPTLRRLRRRRQSRGGVSACGALSRPA